MPGPARPDETLVEQLDAQDVNRDVANAMREVERETVEDMLDFAKDFTEYFTLAAFVRQYAKSRKIHIREN